MADSGRTIFGGIGAIAESSIVYTMTPESPLVLTYGAGRDPIPPGGLSSAAPSVGYYLSTGGDMPVQPWVLAQVNGEALHDEGGGDFSYIEDGIYLSSFYCELAQAASSTADPVQGGSDLTFEDYFDTFMFSTKVAMPDYVSVTWMSTRAVEDWNTAPRLIRAISGTPLKIVSGQFISAKIG